MFPRRVNMEMVDLDPLDDEERAVPARSGQPAPRRDRLGGRRRLLGHWETAVEDFVKVMPKDYKRVLAEQAAVADSNDPTEAVLTAAAQRREVAHGRPQRLS